MMEKEFREILPISVKNRGHHSFIEMVGKLNDIEVVQILGLFLARVVLEVLWVYLVTPKINTEKGTLLHDIESHKCKDQV